MKVLEVLNKDGSVEAHVLRDDGETIASLCVHEPENNGRLDHYGVDVRVRSEPVLRMYGDNIRDRAPHFASGREVATLVSRSKPEKA